jgi:hypothetical protein
MSSMNDVANRTEPPSCFQRTFVLDMQRVPDTPCIIDVGRDHLGQSRANFEWPSSCCLPAEPKVSVRSRLSE